MKLPLLNNKYLAISLSLIVLGLSLVVHTPSAQAACSPPSQSGTDTLSVSVPAAATYRIWSRVMVPDATNNSYSLEIDGGNCITVGGGTIPTNTWTWVDYRDSTTTSKIDVALTAGAHTFKLIGSAPDVSVDRLILSSDTTCVPSGTGDNCANPADTTAPAVSLTAPQNSQTVSGSAVSISATASDSVGVTKVEFYINGSLVGTDTTSSYGISWNTTLAVNGSYQILAKAYDAAGNIGTSTTATVTVNNDTTAPTITVNSPLDASTVSGVITIAATAADNTAVTRVDFAVDGTVKNSDTAAPYSTTIDTTTLTAGAHTISATAYDAAGNSKQSSVSVTVNNSSGTAASGDVTGDGHVTIQDLAILVNNYGKASGATKSQGDLNADGKVTIQDLAILIAHYGQ